MGDVSAKALTKTLRQGFAGKRLYLTFSISKSSRFWAEGFLADIEHCRLPFRGTRYRLRKPFKPEFELYDGDVYSVFPEDEDPDEEKSTEQSEEENFVQVEVDVEFSLANARNTIESKLFGRLCVYCLSSEGRRTPLMNVNTQLKQFLSINRRWGIPRDDDDDVPIEDHHYSWVEIPTQKPRKKSRTKSREKQLTN